MMTPSCQPRIHLPLERVEVVACRDLQSQRQIPLPPSKECPQRSLYPSTAALTFAAHRRPHLNLGLRYPPVQVPGT